ncbi:hypothetical protein [Micromonospora sp. D75]|uniref:hypothetical protein n=2 Tax=Micromonospora TaxID=1873 RepID=UPI001B382763|nr:hypothetical protein [Micromonospora sp. D75]MBQ1066355.1 hypothetical protein [Micromonospora sp. D75]
MGDARRAVPSDADELVRLRGLMLAGMSGAPTPPGRWQDVARDNLRAWLAEPDPWLAAAHCWPGSGTGACAGSTCGPRRPVGRSTVPWVSGRPPTRRCA